MILAIWMAAIAGTAPPPDFAATIRDLDMTSFANSIGPRRRAGATTLGDYGFVRTTAQNARFVRVAQDMAHPWTMSFRLLSRTRDTMTVCFTDLAAGGRYGSYATRGAIRITTDNGRPVATRTSDGRCPRAHSRAEMAQ